MVYPSTSYSKELMWGEFCVIHVFRELRMTVCDPLITGAPTCPPTPACSTRPASQRPWPSPTANRAPFS